MTPSLLDTPRPLGRLAMLGLVAAGGAVGASLRVAVEGLVVVVGGPPITWLLIVNLAGTLALGVAFARLDPRSPRILDIDLPLGELPGARSHHPVLAALVATGFCGALTTYSSMAETLVDLWRDGAVVQAIVLLAVSLVLGPVMIGLGVRLGRLRPR